jgi:hypothetical protein
VEAHFQEASRNILNIFKFIYSMPTSTLRPGITIPLRPDFDKNLALFSKFYSEEELRVFMMVLDRVNDSMYFKFLNKSMNEVEGSNLSVEDKIAYLRACCASQLGLQVRSYPC